MLEFYGYKRWVVSDGKRRTVGFDEAVFRATWG